MTTMTISQFKALSTAQIVAQLDKGDIVVTSSGTQIAVVSKPKLPAPVTSNAIGGKTLSQ